MSQPYVVPKEPLFRLFLRFLRFGLLAWGGPVAQIAMIRQELVDEEHWVSSEDFNRTLAVYQILPGPEAHEMCVYFGMLSRGRIGGVLAGLGFMLPGFLLMLALSWFYVAYGINNPIFAGLFYGFQAAVAALIIRAVHRIGSHAVTNRWLLGIASLAALAQSFGVHFLITLAAAGVAYALIQRRQHLIAILIAIALMTATLVFALRPIQSNDQSSIVGSAEMERASPPALFISGLKAGLLTFGGAYTVIPFLQQDAVEMGRWMTNQTFLDGLALSGILPAPLIIFSTFVGYIGGGFPGALAMTIGIFAPAFGFTLLGHHLLERAMSNKALHTFLDGVTAGVVGLISATSITLFFAAVRDLAALVIFAVALISLLRFKSRLTTPVVVLGAGIVGLLMVTVL